MSVHLGLVAGVIERMGTDEQKQRLAARRWPPARCSPASGSPSPTSAATRPTCSATADKTPEGGYKINARKIFITNGTIAGIALVMARTGGPGGKGVSAFLVPTDTPGFTANKIHGKLGLRSCDTAELVLDDVVVGPDALLGGEEGTGMRAALSALGDGRMSIAASCTGIAQAALDSMVDVHDPAQAVRQGHRGPPAGAGARRGHRRGAGLLAAADMAGRRPQDPRQDYALAASKAKLFATEASVRAANNCIQAYGGYGYVDEYPGGKYLRDARVTTLYEGTSQIQKLIIGRAADRGVRLLGRSRHLDPPGGRPWTSHRCR